MTKIRIVPKGVPHYWAKYDSKGNLKPNAEQANFLSYFDDHAPTTYNTSTTSNSDSNMPKLSCAPTAVASPTENAAYTPAQLPTYVRYLENLIGQVFGIWGFNQRAQLMVLFSQFSSLQSMTDFEKKKLALKIEILFHEMYFVCSPFKNKRAAQLGFFHIVVRFIAEETKGGLLPSQLDSSKLLNLELMRMVNMSGNFSESDSVPSVAEMDSLVEKVNNVCSEAAVQQCSNFALAERRKKLKSGRKSALVVITEDGMAPAKNNEHLKKNERKQQSFEKHLSDSKAEICEDATSPTAKTTAKVPEQQNASSSSSDSNSDKGETPVGVDVTDGVNKAKTAAGSSPPLTVEQASSASDQLATEEPEAKTAATAAGQMAATRKTTIGTRPRAGRKAKHPAKKVNAQIPIHWERKRAAPVETLTADKRIKLQQERERETALAVQLLEQDLALSPDESPNQASMKEVSSVLNEIGAKNVEARHRYIEYRQAVAAIVSAKKALHEPNEAMGQSSGHSVDQLLKSMEMSGGLSFAIRRALQKLATSLKQVCPAVSVLTAYAGSLLDTETAVRYLKVSAKRENSRATIDRFIAECSYIQIWPEMLQQYIVFLDELSARVIDFARENEDLFANSEAVTTEGGFTLPDQPGTVAYLKLLQQLFTSIRLTVSAVGKNGDVAAALGPLAANFQI